MAAEAVGLQKVAEGEPVAVELVYSPAPRSVWRWVGTVPTGATVAHVIEASGLRTAHPDAPVVDGREGSLSLWGRRCSLADPVRARDRVEVSRGLIVDPKEARRQRYAQHQARRAAARPRLKACSPR